MNSSFIYPTILYVLLMTLSTVCCNTGNCSIDCGYKNHCNITTGVCDCLPGYSAHNNGRDCISDNCEINDCVECLSSKCIRCVNFISRKNGECIEQCNGKAQISHDGPLQGNVCSESDGESTDIVIAIVAGVAASLLLLIIIALGVFFYMRKTRRNVNLQEKNYKSRQIEMGNMKQFPVYDNKAFETDSQIEPKVNVIDPQAYATQLEELRPHTETLMTVLGEVRKKLHAMEDDDPRVPTYKGVIHQLCRVLVLLHKKDSATSIPSDALGLFEWAQQMLEDHRAQQEQEGSNSESNEPPAGRISYIDVDPENLPVYATPSHHQNHPTVNDSIDTSGYYSSVPVPLGPNNYATINRSPAHATNVNRNIYSKTNNVKKYVNNVKGRGSVPQMGYFSNGRYYDPNPNTDIYAPTSSYSDRSTGPLSTFLSEKQHSRSRSLSINAESEDGDDDMEDDNGQNDVFPFDPQEATDPVEV
ncbi:uncharacterized protein LOC126811837 [Patella vulgata]|uniref:uncharacterized protein LOC126811837 n=1 Tax=Patella vulgata TaxID=6465 RepID=UPI0021801137|nr:uncharacterized protein LOC126811837 [Patella vulgata]